MAEYMIKNTLSAAGSIDVGIPNDGAVLGVYSTSAVQIEWVFNGIVGQIAPAGTLAWEPHTPFKPRPTSTLRITSAAAATIVVRVC